MTISEGRICNSCSAAVSRGQRQCGFCGGLLDSEPDNPEEWLGLTIDGKYTIEEVLGVGGMGMVFSARRTLVGDYVALKLLYPRFMESTLQRKLFTDEAVAAARLSHPNVVTVFDADVSEKLGVAYIAMELLEGRTLKTVLRDRAPMAFDELVPIAIEICKGLMAAHSAKIIHRDLKPDNIFIETLPDGRSRVKLVDFGIAAMLDEERKEDQRQRIGTLRYMAPEQCQGQAIDARADLYALGVILYEGLTRRRATGKGVTDVLTEIPAIPNTLLSQELQIPFGLEDVLLRLLAKSPHDRPHSAEALAVYLKDLLEEPSLRIEAGDFDDEVHQSLPSPKLLLTITGLFSAVVGIFTGVVSWLLW
ncbi:MAG: serine/threonine protein kinase [Bradymonadia bacterium]